MEGKTHSSKSYAVEGQPSRMASDLATCARDFQSSSHPRPSIRRACRRARDLRVCVVGTGLAGLRCAQVLLQAGVDVTLFEARNRVGGRVCQERLGPRLVDMGPNWVHGTESNPIVRLAVEAKVNLSNLGEESVYFGSDGKPVDEQRVERLDEIIWDIVGEAFGYSNKCCAEIAPELSLRDWFEEKLPQKGLSPEDEALAMQMAQLWGSFIGDSWERQSLKWFWLEECLDGENLYVADSHKAIIDKIAEDLTPRLNLETRVGKAESTFDGEADPSVRISAIHNGQETQHNFNECVVAVPMGCLKRAHINFTPPLPDSMQKAIRNASISSLEKAYLLFPKAFWDRPSGTSSGSDGGDDDALPGFANFLNPAYAPEGHQSWCIELNPLSNTEDFGDSAQPALLFSVFGDSGRLLTSRIADLSPTSKEYLDAVDDFFRPYYSKLPNYSPDDPACKPIAVLATTWQNDEYAHGSYTNFKVHDAGRQVELDEDVRALRHGVPERGIWLAGEHCAPYVGLGTSTGAYWSGEMAAMRVLAAHGLAGEAGGPA